MNHAGDKNEGNETLLPRRRNRDMTKRSVRDLENFDRFMRAMARMIGVPRKRLDRMMFQGRDVPHIQRSQPSQRNRVSSRIAVK
jgi:hypothetical protein